MTATDEDVCILQHPQLTGVICSFLIARDTASLCRTNWTTLSLVTEYISDEYIELFSSHFPSRLFPAISTDPEEQEFVDMNPDAFRRLHHGFTALDRATSEPEDHPFLLCPALLQLLKHSYSTAKLLVGLIASVFPEGGKSIQERYRVILNERFTSMVRRQRIMMSRNQRRRLEEEMSQPWTYCIIADTLFSDVSEPIDSESGLRSDRYVYTTAVEETPALLIAPKSMVLALHIESLIHESLLRPRTHLDISFNCIRWGHWEAIASLNKFHNLSEVRIRNCRSVPTLNDCFHSLPMLKRISFENLDRLTGIEGCFMDCPRLESVSFGDLPQLSEVSGIFNSCPSLKQVFGMELWFPADLTETVLKSKLTPEDIASRKFPVCVRRSPPSFVGCPQLQRLEYWKRLSALSDSELSDSE